MALLDRAYFLPTALGVSINYTVGGGAKFARGSAGGDTWFNGAATEPFVQANSATRVP